MPPAAGYKRSDGVKLFQPHPKGKVDSMAEEEKKDKPKIIVDDDWKAQAQAEKQRLSEEAGKKAERKPDQEEPEGPQEIPPASFPALVNTLAVQAMLALGGVEDPKTKRRYVDLEAAKFHIDTLEVLQEKTKGNLSDEEKSLLDRALYDLRMSYVHIAKHAKRVSPEEMPQKGEKN